MAEQGFLEIDGISKSFGVVEALTDVTFSVRKGEIHTLLGENGAGKSTLVKIIKGELVPDSGALRLEGRTIDEYSPQKSMELGIAIVHQELAVFENMTVAENIFPVSDFLVRKGQIDFSTMNEKARESLKLFDLDISPEEKVENLSLAEQQMVEILRAISREQKVILLDEPTSGLKQKEAEKLMEILRQLRDSGITIIYISHRIPEIMSLSDRITILRDGRYIGTYENTQELTENQLISGMVGREFTDTLYQKKNVSQDSSKKVYLEIKGFITEKSLQNVSFSLYKGEILGVFGLEGSGVLELSRQLYGLDAHDSGELHLQGKPVKKINPGVLMKKGILYLNNNRKEAGLLLDMAASDNMALTSFRQVSTLGFFHKSRLNEITRTFIERFSIVIPSIRTRPRNLSGGNQQKLMMAVGLSADPDCIIINEPTRGVDVGAKVEIHNYILSLAEKGKSLMVFSSELPELISLADRIIVMQNKQIAGELSGEEISEEKVMSYAAGSGIA